ncbi:MAG: hypothetical protein WC145_12025 [Aliarcobacter sp.]
MPNIEDWFEDWKAEFIANLLFAIFAIGFRDYPFYSITLGTVFLCISFLITVISIVQAYCNQEWIRLFNIVTALIAATLVLS